MKVARIVLTQVVVPARPDSIASPGVDRPLHMLSHEGRKGWTVQFDRMPKFVIELHTDSEVVGLGESYRGLPMTQMMAIAKQLIGRDLLQLNWQDLPFGPARLYDGFECAILDAVAHHHGMPLHGLLGGAYRQEIRCSYWSSHRTTDDAVQKAEAAREAGFDSIKFKCDLSDPVVDWCSRIRDACGPDFHVVLDPNGRWESIAEAQRRAAALAEIGNVLCIEDPLPRWNLEEYRVLRQKVAVPVALHVALPYAEMGQAKQDVIRAIRTGACDYFNFNGGIFGVRRMATVADLAGIRYWHGSELDLGILEASYVHKCASFEHGTLPADIFGRLVREHDLLQEPLVIRDGCVRVPSGPGLGVELDREALARYRVGEEKVIE